MISCQAPFRKKAKAAYPMWRWSTSTMTLFRNEDGSIRRALLKFGADRGPSLTSLFSRLSEIRFLDLDLYLD